MAKIDFGGTVEEIITSEEFTLQKAREVLADDTVAVLGYGVQGPGQALNMMEQLAANKLPSSMGFEWTGMSFQENQLKNSQRIQDNPSFILLLSVTFVFLVLAAQYESWTSPAAVIRVRMV